MRFETAVSLHFFKLRCVPCLNVCQNITSQQLQVTPVDKLKCDTDIWGNPIQYGSILDTHDSFMFASSGIVEITPYALPANEAEDIFSIPSALTVMSPEMLKFCWNIPQELPKLELALFLSNKIHDYMFYTPGTTNTNTTAMQSFLSRKGVCQDYSHILISLCRNIGIPARYVNGLMQGTGETHAWVEVYDGKEWRAIDPTNNQLIEYGYIKIAHGRDAADCPVNRGVFTGKTKQANEIRVLVEEIL